MKKIYSLFAIVIVLTAVGLTSCDSSEDVICEPVEKLPDAELTKLYNSIDSLNNEYSNHFRTSFTSKWARRFLVATFDACVGTLTAETGPAAFVCSTVASGLYDDYLDAIDRRFGRIAPFKTRSTSNPPRSVVFPTRNPNFVDSIGYYHNLVITEIKSKGLSFIDRNDNIDYNSYYNEVMSAARRYGILRNVVINKPLIFRYINSVIRPFAHIEEGDKDTILSIIFGGTYNDFNYDSSKTLQLRNVCEKIIIDGLSVDEDQMVEYGTKVNDLIVNSNVDNDMKDTLKVANNIAVNSSLYWSSN